MSNQIESRFCVVKGPKGSWDRKEFYSWQSTNPKSHHNSLDTVVPRKHFFLVLSSFAMRWIGTLTYDIIGPGFNRPSCTITILQSSKWLKSKEHQSISI